MLAPFATLVFLATLLLVARLVAELMGESGERILAALRGQQHRIVTSLPPVRMRLSAPRPVRPLRASRPRWRAAA